MTFKIFLLFLFTVPFAFPVENQKRPLQDTEDYVPPLLLESVPSTETLPSAEVPTAEVAPSVAPPAKEEVPPAETPTAEVAPSAAPPAKEEVPPAETPTAEVAPSVAPPAKEEVPPAETPTAEVTPSVAPPAKEEVPPAETLTAEVAPSVKPPAKEETPSVLPSENVTPVMNVEDFTTAIVVNTAETVFNGTTQLIPTAAEDSNGFLLKQLTEVISSGNGEGKANTEDYDDYDEYDEEDDDDSGGGNFLSDLLGGGGGGLFGGGDDDGNLKCYTCESCPASKDLMRRETCEDFSALCVTKKQYTMRNGKLFVVRSTRFCGPPTCPPSSLMVRFKCCSGDLCNSSSRKDAKMLAMAIAFMISTLWSWINNLFTRKL